MNARYNNNNNNNNNNKLYLHDYNKYSIAKAIHKIIKKMNK